MFILVFVRIVKKFDLLMFGWFIIDLLILTWKKNISYLYFIEDQRLHYTIDIIYNRNWIFLMLMVLFMKSLILYCNYIFLQNIIL